MNKTQLRGVQTLQSAFAFIGEEMAAVKQRQLKKQRQYRLIAKRFTTTATIAALVVAINLPEIKAQAMDGQPVIETPAIEANYDGSIKLDPNSYSLLVIEQTNVEIKPGRSLHQLAELEKARLAASTIAQKPTTPVVNKTVTRVSIEEARQLVKQAAVEVGIADQWRILEAIWQVETGKAVYSCVISGADGRAVGPMQFMPGTFRAYKTRSDANICDAKDALPAAANLLKRNGVNHNVNQAIFNYNHSNAYVEKVKRIAQSIP